MLGYFFCDLGRHEYIAKFASCLSTGHELRSKFDNRRDRKDASKSVRHVVQYPRMSDALQHTWKGLNKRQTKELNPAVVFTVLGEIHQRSSVSFVNLNVNHNTPAILEWQAAHGGQLPDDLREADELESLANSLLKERAVNTDVITSISRDQIECVPSN